MRFLKLICSLLLVFGTLTLPAQSRAQVAVGVSVRIGPPLLPVYEQPLCPGEGYIWTPGYWAYADDGYYWVPGTWVLPPEEGLLWTPGYWAGQDDAYVWYSGYWGPVVGFYGGINYGFGYPGVGFYGGYWRGHNYYYNRNAANIDIAVVHNTYNTTVVQNTTFNRVSFNGGSGGTTARPTSVEIAASRQRRIAMTSEQVQHQHAAASNRNLFASVNHGRPDVAATSRPSEFSNRGAAPTLRKGNSNHQPENRRDTRIDTNRPENRPPANARPNDNRSPNADRVNPGMMEKQQREQEKLRQQQDVERQRMEQKHAQEQQKLGRRNADAQRQQELGQRHQQQAQQLQQKHDQQAQKLQQRQDKQAQRQQSKPPKPEHPPHNQQ